MTQIPEAGSIWVNNIDRTQVVEVLFADDVSVYFHNSKKDGYIARGERSTSNFLDYFKPKPQTVTHRVWVNLYRSGQAGELCATKEAALDRAKLNDPSSKYIAETRCIEWEVEE